ncbi:IclR family transcriptional regulator [Streptomyces montanus]|uniref:IclR family transcriptional regulator n=1 Tax=Streptomyces montanus TaxID=2580423 RepID=A0A5R9FVX7_9ACTN|nr:IclR family transcriptional regulator [Streptomyces montanus]TLS48147.1 IclR family transcriptional regulator [Streptomyces montanus]
MAKPMKNPPTYGVTSVDHALQLAVILQVEGPLTVSEAAQRLGVARSTAHRLLSTLVYRDFAVRNEDRTYRVGPVLEIADRTQSNVAAVRAAALGPMRALVDALDETVNLSIRTGRTVRFIASVECAQALRVGSREGMVFPAHQVTGGLVMLAALDDEDLAALYAPSPTGGSEERPDLTRLRTELRAVRQSGVALNLERSERGVVAVGRGVTDSSGHTVAAVSVSMPSVRHSPHRLNEVVAALTTAAEAISTALEGGTHDPTRT